MARDIVSLSIESLDEEMGSPALEGAGSFFHAADDIVAFEERMF